MPHDTEVSEIVNVFIWVLLILGVIWDFKKYQIPNWLIGFLYVAGMIINLKMYGPTGVCFFIIRAVLPVILLFLLFKMGGLGAGDIKMFSAISTVVGLKSVGRIFVYSVLIAGAVALLYCIYDKCISKRRLHYCLFIAAGFLCNTIRSLR